MLDRNVPRQVGCRTRSPLEAMGERRRRTTARNHADEEGLPKALLGRYSSGGRARSFGYFLQKHPLSEPTGPFGGDTSTRGCALRNIGAGA